MQGSEPERGSGLFLYLPAGAVCLPSSSCRHAPCLAAPLAPTIGCEPGGPYICLRGLPPPAPWPGLAAFHSSMVCSLQPRVLPTYTSGSGSLYRASAPLVMFRRSATSVRLRYLQVTACVLLQVRTRRRPARIPAGIGCQKARARLQVPSANATHPNVLNLSMLICLWSSLEDGGSAFYGQPEPLCPVIVSCSG